MVDALDTMVLMGHTEQYLAAVQWLRTHLPAKLARDVDVPFFEVAIRVLGGLLGAHTLSPDPALLALAKQAGEALLPAFNSPSGVPFCSINLARANASCPSSDFGESIPLAEMGSVQLEFAELSRLLGDPKFALAADGAVDRLRRTLRSRDGLYPSRIRPARATPASREVGFGSGSDSFYETLLKRWLQSGEKTCREKLP